MASGYVQVPPDSTGKKVDCTSISSGAVRQVIVVGDPTTSSGFATVTGGKLNVNASVGTLPNVTIGSMPNVNVSSMPTVTVQGNISATIIGSVPNINISAMPAVNISAMPNVKVDTISATVTVAGTVTIGGGSVAVSNNIGVDRIVQTVNAVLTQAINISSMPAISIGPISTIDKISATVTVAGTVNISTMPAITVSVGPITTIDKISATVTVAGNVTLTGTNKIDNISATVNVAVTNSNLFVSSPVSPGAALAGYWPVIVGGIDDGNLVRVLKTDTTGQLQVGGTVNISSMPAISVGPISTIDKISATVLVAGNVTLTGTNKIDNISATVVVAGVVSISGTVPISGTIDKISAAVAVSSLPNVNISAMPNVVLAAGANNIGTLNGISATVLVASAYPRAVPSASHGPVTKSLSASATVALAAAPGIGLSVYVTSMLVTNGSPTLTQLQVYEASATGAPTLAPYLAASGGGFQHTFDPPWKVSANTALNARLKPSVVGVVTVTLNFVVGA